MQHIYDVRDFGAVGDGITEATQAIQTAIDTCSADGGGTVLVTCGTYLFYPLRLRSFVRLKIDWNAKMLAGTDPAKYPLFEKNPIWDVDYALRGNHRCVIYALGEQHVSICGKGTFDFQGTSFVNVDPTMKPFQGHWKRKSDTEIPGRCLFFVGCTDVSLEDVFMTNPAGWFTWFLKCERVRVTRVTLRADLCMPNSDGIHLGSCKNAVISDCDISTGDDCIIVRGMQEQFDHSVPCEDIVVTNCILQSSTAAVRIGWTHDGLQRNCTFSNLVIRESRAGLSIAVPAMRNPQPDPPRYGDFPPPKDVEPFAVENITFSNIVADTHEPLLFIKLAPDAAVNYIRHIAFRGVNAVSDVPPTVIATPEQHVSDLEFSDVNIELRPVPNKPDGSNAAMHFMHTENVQFNNFRIRKSC